MEAREKVLFGNRMYVNWVTVDVQALKGYSKIELNSYPMERFGYSNNKREVTRSVVFDDDGERLTRIGLPNIGMLKATPHDAYDRHYLRKKKRPLSSRGGRVVRSIDLFSGCGGLSLGVWEACRALGAIFKPVMAIDEDPAVLQVYGDNFGHTKTRETDITNLIDGKIGGRATRNEKEIHDEIGDVDIVLSGPPCQGHSNLNNYTRRKDIRNSLYERIVRFVEIFRPEHVLIENVPQVLLDEGGVLQKSIMQLIKLDYSVSHDVIDMSLIGVPQRRKRHVLIASRTKTLSASALAESFRIPCKRSLRWCIEDLEHVIGTSPFDAPTKLSDANVERVNYLFDRDVYNLPNNQRPQCHWGEHSYLSMYGRLKWDDPAPTITTGFLSPGQGRYIHPSQRRTITPYEAARIQFFPDFFDFSSAPTRESLKKMIGNAAPMKLGYVFALGLLA